MFDWQVELAPPPSPATTPPRISTPAPLALVINNDSSSPIAAPMQIAKPSFAQALRGPPAITDPHPLPSIRGETLSVSISASAYSRGVDYCKINLRGRLVSKQG